MYNIGSTIILNVIIMIIIIFCLSKIVVIAYYIYFLSLLLSCVCIMRLPKAIPNRTSFIPGCCLNRYCYGMFC